MKKFLAILTTGVLLIVGTSIAANAAGSDSPTPYEVTTEGITLPAGDTFPAHGHVNIKTTDGKGHGIHFDPNNDQPGGAWIGKNHIPWSAFGLKSGDCVTWVQISHYNEHFGEGGQAPVCIDKPEPVVKHGAVSSQNDYCDSPLNGSRIFRTERTEWTEVDGVRTWAEPVVTIDTVADPECDYKHPEPEVTTAPEAPETVTNAPAATPAVPVEAEATFTG